MEFQIGGKKLRFKKCAKENFKDLKILRNLTHYLTNLTLFIKFISWISISFFYVTLLYCNSQKSQNRNYKNSIKTMSFFFFFFNKSDTI